MNNYHTPVLLHEAIEFLNVKPSGLYIDATLGGGGHALEVAKRGGKVLGIDTDQDAVEYVSKIIDEKIKVTRGNFKDIDIIARENDFTNVDGILFDLGVSSHQLETAGRGFSFQKEGPLDMRMDNTLAVKASDLLNALPQKELFELFKNFGEERHAYALAKNIVSARVVGPITTTRDLVEIVDKTVHSKEDKHKATRAFQALRIAVNDELTALSEALPKAFGLLKSDGRLVVISFHSLEDRIVKEKFKKLEEEGQGEILTKKPIEPSLEEVQGNPRARSAKIRAIKKNE